MIDNCLEYDLKSLVEDIDLDIDKKYEECHLFIDYYVKSKNEKILPVLKGLNEGTFPSIYAELPYYLGYDSYCNGMKNYHLLIPVVVGLEVSSIIDLWTLYKSLCYTREEMYDEWSQVQRHFISELVKYSSNIKEDEKELFDILVKLSVCNKLINAKYLKLLQNVEFNSELLKNVNNYAENIISKKGLREIIFCE